jgi:hypothetical protein
METAHRNENRRDLHSFPSCLFPFQKLATKHWH